MPIKHIHIDQFGYRPGDTKVATIQNPQSGYGSDEPYVPGSTIQVRNTRNNEVVFSGSPVAWNGGATHAVSGDKAWNFDFSSVTRPGNYVLVDTKSGGEISHPFRIHPKVYHPVLAAALKTYYYQRSSQHLSRRYARRWMMGNTYPQDANARLYTTPNSAASAKDLRGGHFDAGDTNRYATFAAGYHLLMDSYQAAPTFYAGFKLGIPESNNSLPDILDIVKYEIDGWVKCQNPDGGVLLKVGVLEPGSGGVWPMSDDARPRYYAPPATSSTISVAGLFAHFALIMRDLSGYSAYAADLQARAVSAFDWYKARPTKDTNVDPDNVSPRVQAGVADRDADWQDAAEFVAATYLLALTGDKTKYNPSIVANYNKTHGFVDYNWGSERSWEANAAHFYTTLASNLTDAATVTAINNRYAEVVLNSWGFQIRDTDPYRASLNEWDYHWGSNYKVSSFGAQNYRAIANGKVSMGNVATFRARGLACLNYLHGVNPLGKVFLSNAQALGAKKGVDIFYHYQWGRGDYGNGGAPPPPGFLVGGVDQYYAGSEYAAIAAQPIAKRYAEYPYEDFAKEPWRFTEPSSTGYQPYYLELLTYACQ